MTDTITRLRERRGRIWEQMKDLVDSVETEDRAFSAEEDQSWERMNADLQKIDERLADMDRAASEEERQAEIRERFDRLAAREPEDRAREMHPEEKRFLEFLAGKRKAADFSLRGLSTRDGREIDARALDFVNDSQNETNLRPTSFVRSLYEHLVETSSIRQLPVTVMRTTSGEEMQIPKTTAATSAASIVAENAQISESLPTFGQATLNAYKYGFLRQLSAEFLADEAAGVMDFLARDGARALALGTDAHFWTGDGSSKPNGIVTASTEGVSGGTGQTGIPTADEIIDLFYSVTRPYRQNGYWAMSDATMAEVRKLKDDNNQYLWVPGLQAGEADRILGKPVITDPNIADAALDAKSVVFGDFSSYVIREVGSIRIERSDDFAFDYDLATIRYLGRWDGELVDQTGAVKHYVGGSS